MEASNPTNDIVSYLKSQGITKLYHFTDILNLESIFDNGGLYSWKACVLSGIKTNYSGGNKLSRMLDSRKGLDNYVRLSFVKQHPMMYVAKRELRINKPVILEIDISAVELPNTKFSDRNATNNGAIIASGYQGAKNIHFSTVQQFYFDLDEEEKPFYQAEVLIFEKVPSSYILNFPELFKELDTYRESNFFWPKSSYDTKPANQKTQEAPKSKFRKFISQDGTMGCICWIIVAIIVIIIRAILRR